MGVAGGSRRVAVVGSGITGLSTAWLLQRSGAEVVLFEKEVSCGGHTLTDTSGPAPVDLGFQVYNLTTYPNLTGLLDALGVDTEPSDMSFALSSDGGKLEWGSRGLGALFAQRGNLFSPSFWCMVVDVVRFGNTATEVLSKPQFAAMSTGEYLRQKGFSTAFVRHYFLPMCAAVWSVPESQETGLVPFAQMLKSPVVSLIRFWKNHHLLDLVQRPVWRVVKDRSHSYVKAICAELRDVRTGTAVAAVESLGAEGPVRVTTADGTSQQFDAVVLATHSDISLKLLGDGCPKEVREVLAAVPYNDNEVWLHTDASLMPRSRAAWASWNFLGSSGDGSADAAVCVTYWLNLLQNLPPGTPEMFVTLNPPQPPAPNTVLRKLTLAHPVFGPQSVAAQAALPSVQGVVDIQGKGGVYLGGAWTGYGFHEDGLKAGIAVAQLLGATIPWTPRAANPKMGLLATLGMRVFDRFAKAAISTGHLRVILPNGEELSYGDPAAVEPPVVPGEEWRGRPRLRATIRLYNLTFFRKIITRHDTGMGEAYMDGDYEVDDLGGLLAVACANANNIEASRGLLGFLNTLGGWALRAAHAARSNTIAGSRKNIEEHYDAGNAMYKLFLDETLTYSCGIHSPGGSLKHAQLAKLDTMLAAADVKSSDQVLEIGCGWGSMAIRAVQTTGCRWTGITISKEQLAEATQRVKEAGLSDRITLLFCDYRKIPAAAGSFDKVVSCEMIEAVGQEHLPTYFAAIDAALKPGGKAIIQVIAEPDERYEAYCESSDFIREHIFPGGHLPSMGAMVQAAAPTSLQVHDCKDIGPDYAITLREWRAAWEAKKEAVLQLGYSERFWRKYRFYFAYCEAAFDERYIHDFHVLWVKSEDAAVPMMDGAAPTLEQVASPYAGARNAPDPITQVLLAIYFFLAGWAVGQRRALLLMPIATSACAALLWITSAASHALLPRFRAMDAEARTWWATDIVHLVYSAATSVAVAAYVAAHPQVLSVAAPPADAVLPDVIVCVSAGFFAFLLWILVAYRIYRRSYMKMLHLTTLLVLFAAAAHKSDHTALLAAALISEAHTVFSVVRRLQDALQVGEHSASRTLIVRAERVSLAAFRLLPHAVLTAIVALQPSAFATPARYTLATAGLLYINAANVVKAVRTYGAAGKLKAQ